MRVVATGTTGNAPRNSAYWVTEGEAWGTWRRCFACRTVVEPASAVCRSCHPVPNAVEAQA